MEAYFYYDYMENWRLRRLVLLSADVVNLAILTFGRGNDGLDGPSTAIAKFLYSPGKNEPQHQE